MPISKIRKFNFWGWYFCKNI